MSYEKAYLGKNYGSLDIGNRISSYSNIILNFRSDSEEVVSVRYPIVEVPGDTYEIELPCVTNSQHALQMAQNILSRINQYSLNPYKVTEGYIDPAVELGDGITIDGLYSTIGELQYEFDPLSTASIGSFIQNDEVEDEFQFESSSLKRIERIIAKTSASFRIDIDRIVGEVSGKITTFRQATVPTALATGDLWYCMANITGTTPYKKDTWYRWSGSAWEESSEDINIPVAPAWARGTSYQKGDVVDEGGVWYAAKSNHTATSANKPPNSTYWEIRSTISEISKSQISQTMSDITLTVNESSLRLTGGGLDIVAPTANLKVNAANITGTLTVGWGNVSGKPSFSSVATSGSYNDLSNKPSIPTDYSITTIIENTVTTGFVDALGVSAVELIGNSIYLRDDDNYRAATLHLTGDRSSWDLRELEIESGNIYINSQADFVVITGGYGGRLTFSSEVIAESDFTCSPAGGHDLGYSSSSGYWRDLFIENDPTVVSDRKKKKDINYDLADMDGFFDDLKPAAFRFINGSSGRRHFGMIAQDVEENLAAHGIDPIDFAGFCKDTTEDDDGQDPEKGDGYALRYGEFISLCIDQIQKLKVRVKDLETAS